MKLNQIIALEKGVKGRTHGRLMELLSTFQKAPLLNGISRVYRPRDEEGEQLPPEQTNVQVKAKSALAAATEAFSELIDLTVTKDTANQEAYASVIVGGTTLVEDVPVTTLLFLEKQLAELAGFVRRIPTLDPAESWEWSEISGVYTTPVIQTVRSKKVPRNWVKAEATPQHPAQVDVYYEDIAAGYWDTVKYSGAMPKAEVNKILERITAVQDAVKIAREAANSMEVQGLVISPAIFSYILS